MPLGFGPLGSGPLGGGGGGGDNVLAAIENTDSAAFTGGALFILEADSLIVGQPVIYQLPSGTAYYEAVLAAVENKDIAALDGEVINKARLQALDNRDVAAFAGWGEGIADFELWEARDSAHFDGIGSAIGDFALTDGLDQAAFAGSLDPSKHYGAQILYSAATGFEKALADVDADRITATPAELIRDIWDPERCPEDLLPYLAWAFGVEFWNDHWSEVTKRAWIAVQWLFKSYRGTAAALRMAIDYAGRDVSWRGYSVEKITARPQQIFSGPSLTKAEREAWLSRMPQVRAWRVQEQGTAGAFKAFLNASNSLRLHSRRFCLGGTPLSGQSNLVVAPTPSTALQRLKRRVRWIENNVETETKVTEFGSYWRIHRYGELDSKVFSDRCFGVGSYYVPSDAWQRLITVEPQSKLAWRSPVTPTLQAITSEPERITISGVRDSKVFCDVPLYGGYFVPSDAYMRIYERYAVLDPSIREFRRPAVQFMGVGRYGFPSFTAWVDVRVNNKLNKWEAGFGYYGERRFWIPHDGTAIEQVRLAAQASKALRDKILLRSGPKPRFLAGGTPVLADIDDVIVGRP